MEKRKEGLGVRSHCTYEMAKKNLNCCWFLTLFGLRGDKYVNVKYTSIPFTGYTQILSTYIYNGVELKLVKGEELFWTAPERFFPVLSGHLFNFFSLYRYDGQVFRGGGGTFPPEKLSQGNFPPPSSTPMVLTI